MFTPLKITFHLDTAMAVSAYPIHLDALLAYAVTEKKMRRLVSGRASLPEGMLRDLARDLPLEKEERDGVFVWKASALVPEEIVDRSTRLWTRKTNPYDFSEKVVEGFVRLSSRAMTMLNSGAPYALDALGQKGIPTDRCQHYSTAMIKVVHSWCIGDADQIESLLSPESGFITHLGRLARIGHGHIASIQIEEDATALTQWKRRVLPWQEDGYEPIEAAFQPPYWAVENMTLAYCPADI